MSLDVYLEIEEAVAVSGDSLICVRVDGRILKITWAEWNKVHPDREPIMSTPEHETNTVYHGNITHNLGKMAREAGIYQALWRPEEVGIITGSELIELLIAGLQQLRSDPERFKSMNPPNGWGSYQSLLEFTGEYLMACMAYPNATVRVWR